MNTRPYFLKALIIISSIFSTALPITASADSSFKSREHMPVVKKSKKHRPSLHHKPGNPIKHLQEQIDALQAQLDDLSPGPEQVEVNCDTGETIMDALATGASTITVSGSCNENVAITRDDISLIADVDGGTVTAASGGFQQAAIFINDAHRINISGLIIEGHTDTGSVGILVTNGASATISDVTIENGANGIQVNINSNISIANSTIRNNTNFGVNVNGSTVGILDSVITDNGVGLTSSVNGNTFIVSSTFENNNSEISLFTGSNLSSFGGLEVNHEATAAGGVIFMRNSSFSSFPIGSGTTISTDRAGSPAIIAVGNSNLQLNSITITGAINTPAINMGDHTSAVFFTGVTVIGSGNNPVLDLSNYANVNLFAGAVVTAGINGTGINMNDFSNAAFFPGASLTGGVNCTDYRAKFSDNSGTVTPVTGCTP